MKFTKKKDYAGTVRTIWNDDKAVRLGVVGTFKDFMDLGIIEKATNYSLDTWVCLPETGRIERWDGIGSTREEAIKNAVFGR